MKKVLQVSIYICIIVFLTLLTQVGGIIFIITMLIAAQFKLKKRYIFPALYLIANLFIIPPLAKVFGRVPLPVVSETLYPRNYCYPLFFRNYVTPELKHVLEYTAGDLKQANIPITYLDANFPFYDGFPLLPHLSHNDGKKVDLSFMYTDQNNSPTIDKPSFSGYGVFVESELNTQTEECKNKGYWQYDFPKYLTFGTSEQLFFDTKNTILLLNSLLKNASTQKIFIEPHLKQSLGFNQHSKVRFHGCRAVRHDDHIHLQIK